LCVALTPGCSPIEMTIWWCYSPVTRHLLIHLYFNCITLLYRMKQKPANFWITATQIEISFLILCNKISKHFIHKVYFSITVSLRRLPSLSVCCFTLEHYIWNWWRQDCVLASW